jgi:hypothetical protein
MYACLQMPSTSWRDFLKFCKVAGIVIISALGRQLALALYNEWDRADHGAHQAHKCAVRNVSCPFDNESIHEFIERSPSE